MGIRVKRATKKSQCTLGVFLVYHVQCFYLEFLKKEQVGEKWNSEIAVGGRTVSALAFNFRSKGENKDVDASSVSFEVEAWRGGAH